MRVSPAHRDDQAPRGTGSVTDVPRAVPPSIAPDPTLEPRDAALGLPAATSPVPLPATAHEPAAADALPTGGEWGAADSFRIGQRWSSRSADHSPMSRHAPGWLRSWHPSARRRSPSARRWRSPTRYALGDHDAGVQRDPSHQVRRPSLLRTRLAVAGDRRCQGRSPDRRSYVGQELAGRLAKEDGHCAIPAIVAAL
jgi:hypothetical protein